MCQPANMQVRCIASKNGRKSIYIQRENIVWEIQGATAQCVCARLVVLYGHLCKSFNFKMYSVTFWLLVIFPRITIYMYNNDNRSGAIDSIKQWQWLSANITVVHQFSFSQFTRENFSKKTHLEIEFKRCCTQGEKCRFHTYTFTCTLEHITLQQQQHCQLHHYLFVIFTLKKFK